MPIEKQRENCVMKSFDENKDIFRYQYIPLQIITHTKGLGIHTTYLFRLAHIISWGSDFLLVFPRIFHVIRIFQSIIAFLLPAMFLIEGSGEYQSIFHSLFRLLAPFPTYLSCILSSCLTLTSIVAFFFGYFYLKKHFVSKHLAFFIYLFGGELPIVYTTILCSNISNIIASIIQGKGTSKVPNLIILTLLYFIDMVIVYYNETTMITSLLYDGGRSATCTEPKKSILFNNILILIVTITFCALDRKNFLIISIILFLSFGILAIIRGRSTMFIRGKPDIETVSKGLAMLTCALFMFLLVNDVSVLIKVVGNTILAVYFLSYVILNYYYMWKGKKIAKELNDCDLDFDDLNIKSFNDLVSYMDYGFCYGAKTAINGEFLEWGLKKYSFDDLSCMMTVYASLLNTPPLYASYFSDNDKGVNGFYDLFVRFEYYVIRMSSTVNDLPEDVVYPIKEAINRCTLYPEQEEMIVSHFSTDINVNYLLLQLINNIKKDLEFFTQMCSEFFPNSLFVLRLSYLYYKNVEKDVLRANEIKKYINELNADNSKYVSLRFLEPIAMLPEAQKAINEYNNIQFYSYAEQNNEKNEKNDIIRKSDSSSSDNENPEEIKPLRYIHYNKLNNFISYSTIAISFISLVVAFFFYYYSVSADIKLQKTMVGYANDVFEIVKHYSLGTVGAIIQMHGDGCGGIIEQVKEHYDNFTRYSVALNVYQNIDSFDKTSYLKELINEITLIVSYPSPASSDVNISTSYYSALSEVYDYIYESIDKTFYSNTIDKVWFNYLSSMQYFISVGWSRNFSITINRGLKNWADISFLQNYNCLYHGIWLSFVSIFILVLFLTHRIYLVYKVSRRLQTKTKETERIGLYLDKSYSSAKRSCAKYTLYILILLAIVILVLFSIYAFVKKFNSDFKKYMENSANDISAISISFAAVTSYELALFKKNIPEDTIKVLNDVRDFTLRFFLTNETDCSVQLERCHTKVFNLIHYFITNNIDSSTHELVHKLRDSFIHDVVDGVVSYNNVSYEEQQEFFIKTHEFFVSIMFLVYAAFIAYIFIVFDIVIFVRRIYIQMVSLENRFDNIFMFRFSNTNATNNDSSILDVIRIEQPCCLTTDTEMIIEVNTVWKNIFGKEGHDYVGKPQVRYLSRFSDSPIITRQVGENMNLTVIDVNPKVIEEKKRLKELSNIVKKYTTGFNSSIFKNSLVDSYSYNFLSMVSIIWNSEDTYTATKEMEEIDKFVAKISKSYVDLEVIKNSYRQYMFLFGSNESVSIDIVATQAVSFALEMLLYTSKNSSEKKYVPQCVVVSGKGVCKLPESRLGMVSITGEIINKTKSIIALSVPNSITICKNTFEQIQSRAISPFNPDLFKPIVSNSNRSGVVSAYNICI